LKIVIWPNINEKSSDFDEIWYANADLELDDIHVTKYEIFKNSRWRTAAILEIVLVITQQPIARFQ